MMPRGRDGVRRVAIDLAATAAIALGVFLPFVGLVSREGQSALFIGWRPVALVVVVALCVLARALILARGIRVAPSKLLGPLLLLFGLTLPFWAGRYYLDLGVLVLTYIMLAWGLNIVVGLAGLLDLGYVAFYAVGAYSYAIFSTTLGLGFWVSLPIAALLAALWGICLGFPVLRLKGDYLAIVTLAFGEIIRIVILNWTSLTNGPNGISGIPRPTLFGLTFNMSGAPGTFAHAFGLTPSLNQRLIYLYYIILGLALFTSWVTSRLRRSPLGRAWEALREDEIACRALGINVTITKLTAFAIGASFGGLAGAFFATRQSFISPESFTFIESAIVLAIVVLGGLGSQFGTALAAIVMIGGLEVLRDVLSQVATANASNWLSSFASELPQYRMLLFGLALILVMVVKPRGLVSGRVATIALSRPREIPESVIAEAQHVH